MGLRSLPPAATYPRPSRLTIDAGAIEPGAAGDEFMQRRAFLTGILGISAATALSGLFGTGRAEALPSRGILDQLDAREAVGEDEELTPAAEEIRHDRGRRHHRRDRRHHRRHHRRRRREWRRYCRSEWWNGRRRRRCRRGRVWVWY